MKKILLGGLIILVIAAVAAPFVNGLMMEKVLHSQLEKYNEHYADLPFYPKLDMTRYDRGFGSSEIEWTITIPQLQNSSDFAPIVLVEKAQHGYMGVSSTTSLNQNSWYTDFIREKLGGKDPLSITSQYNLLNGLKTTISLAAFEMLDDKSNRFIVKPAEIVVKTDSDFENILTEANFAGFSFADQADIKGIALRSEMQMISSFIMDGTSSIAIDQVDIRDNGKNRGFALSSFEGVSNIDFDETHKKLSLGTTYAIGKIATAKGEIEDVRCTFKINQLDSAGFENVYKVYVDMLGDTMATLEMSQHDPELAKELMKQQMTLVGVRLMSEVEKLLKKDLQIEIADLHISLPQGEVQGDLAISLKRDMTLAGFMVLAQQPEMLTEIFSFTSHLALPDGLLPNQERLLVPVHPNMQSGIFEKQGETLVHSAEIRDNRFFLNDKEFELSSL